jgi:hypothetical protein
MKIFIKIFVLAIFGMLFWQVNFVSASPTAIDFLSVDFQGDDPDGTLFGEAFFLPGDTVTRWAKVTNLTDRKIAVKIVVSGFLQTGGMAEKIDFLIKKHGNTDPVFNGTLKKLNDDGILIIDPALSAGVTQQYDFSATFKPESGREYMGMSVNFNLNIGSDGEINGEEKKFIYAVIINGDGSVLLPTSTPKPTLPAVSIRPSSTPKTSKFPFFIAQDDKKPGTGPYNSPLAGENGFEQNNQDKGQKNLFASIGSFFGDNWLILIIVLGLALAVYLYLKHKDSQD